MLLFNQILRAQTCFDFMNKLHITFFIITITLIGYLFFIENQKTIVFQAPPFEEIPTGGFSDDSESQTLWQDEESGFYFITYNLSGIEDGEAENDINRFISDKVFDFKSNGNFENLTQEEIEILGFNRGAKYSLAFSYELKESHGIKSYIVRSDSYLGGAHGNSEIMSFNYDKNTGNRLSLNNIFKVLPQNYLPILSSFGEEYFNTELPESFFAEGVAPLSTNWSVWYATDESLVFIFQPYQVAPYVYGVGEMSVPLEHLSLFLDQKYFNN